MKKDAYYFPHFSNARNDAKVIKLRRVLGLEGYGIYFMLLEILREQTDFKYPIMGIEDLAYEWHVSKEKIASVISDFGLFEIVEDIFFSPKFILYLQPYIEKTERARAAANKRWAAVKSDANAYANALPQQCEVDANGMQGKESKRKESINKKNTTDYIKSANTFYSEQINSIPENERRLNTAVKYNDLKNFLFGANELQEPLSDLLQIEKQITYEQFKTLYAKASEKKRLISDIMYSMLNVDKYTKGKKSLYLTINNWLSRD